MNEREFCYWLQGWFELNKTIDHQEGVRQETLEMIQDHLNIVFDKVTPNVSTPIVPLGETKPVIEVDDISKQGGNPPFPDINYPPFHDINYPSWPLYPVTCDSLKPIC